MVKSQLLIEIAASLFEPFGMYCPRHYISDPPDD